MKDNTYIKQFIGAIIPDIKHPNLNTNGDIGLTGNYIDDTLAYSYYSNLKDFLTSYSIQFKLYGKEYSKEIQVLDLIKFAQYLKPKDIEGQYTILSQEAEQKLSTNLHLQEATSIFTQHIDVYLRGGVIDDAFFQMVLQLMDYLDVFEITLHDKKELVFLPKNHVQHRTTQVEIKEDDAFYTTNQEGELIKEFIKPQRGFDVILHKPINKLDPEAFRYNNIMLLIKEVQQGFVDMRKHSLALKNDRNKYELHEYKIGEDIEILLDKENHKVLSVSKKETEYTTLKIDGIWCVCHDTNPIFKPVPTDEFKYSEITTKNNITTISLKGAYTHILRDILGFKPQTWQYKYLINERYMNYVAGVRRGGKTLLSSYRIIRFLYKQPSSGKHILRNPKGIYVVPTKDKFKAVIDYIETQSDKIKVLKSLVFYKEQKRLVLSDDKLDFAGNKYEQVQATYDFASSQGYKTGVGAGGDDVTIDEASSIDVNVWLNLAPIVTNEGATLFAISTIDWKTPKQWFYEALTKYERTKPDDVYTQRVTIDDIDDNIMDENAKTHAKEALAAYPARYLGELYATFSSDSQVFSSEGSVVLECPLDFEEIYIGYDPAKRFDFGGVVVAGSRDGNLYFIEEYQLKGTYISQKERLLEIKSRYMKKFSKVTLIMDGTAAGDVVAEMFGNMVDYKVWYTGDVSSNYKPMVDQFGSWKVSKTRLVTITQMLFEMKNIKILSEVTKLQSEIQNFKSYESNGKVKYDAISGEHDDLVNAMMLVSFAFGYIQGKANYIEKDNNRIYRSILRDNIDPTTGLQKEFRLPLKNKQARKELQILKGTYTSQSSHGF